MGVFLSLSPLLHGGESLPGTAAAFVLLGLACFVLVAAALIARLQR